MGSADRISRVLAVLAFVAGWAGCSTGSDVSGGGPDAAATAGDTRALCEAQCDRRERCAGDAAPESELAACRQECTAPPSPLLQRARADMIRALSDCTASLECGTNDEICTARAAEAVGLDPDAVLEEEDVQACLAKHDACDGTPGAFSDDLCGSLVFLVRSARSQADACFDEPCDAIGECLAPIFAE